MSAQRNGDRATQGVGTNAGRHRYNGVVDKGFARHKPI